MAKYIDISNTTDIQKTEVQPTRVFVDNAGNYYGVFGLSLSQIIPIGVILMWITTTAPSGWLICDGTAISRTTYANLFSVIGTTYGTGDGSSTFNIPDMRQRFPLGKATSGTGVNLGSTGGAIDHTHTVTPATLENATITGVTSVADDTQVTSSANNPPFLTVNFIIKT